MRFFAMLTIHPVKMDGIPRPGSSKGLPTNERDTTRFIEACGSDAYVPLDGRWKKVRRLRHVLDYLNRHRNVRRYAGFEIHHGTIRNSRVIAAYRITEYYENETETGVRCKSLPGLDHPPDKPHPRWKTKERQFSGQPQ